MPQSGETFVFTSWLVLTVLAGITRDHIQIPCISNDDIMHNRSSMLLAWSNHALRQHSDVINSMDVRAVLAPITKQYSFTNQWTLLSSLELLSTVCKSNKVILLDTTTQCNADLIKQVLEQTTFEFMHVFADSDTFRDDLLITHSTKVLHCHVALLETIRSMHLNVTIVYYLPRDKCKRYANESTCTCSYDYANYSDGLLQTLIMFTQLYKNLHGLRIYFIFLSIH